jgi:transcriptional regulator with XRE-family HTH domain
MWRWKDGEFDRQLGQRLKALRVTLGYSVTEAASAIGVTAGTWRRWEKGNGWIRYCGVTRAIAEKFDINERWLAYGKGRFLPLTEDEDANQRRAKIYAARGFLSDAGQPFRPLTKH